VSEEEVQLLLHLFTTLYANDYSFYVVHMMREIKNVRQVRDERHRRWFESNNFDLIVWYDDQDRMAGFQLCYGKGDNNSEHALTWNAPASYSHMAVDDGEGRPFRYKATPILVPDGTLDTEALYEAFVRESAELPPEIVSFVVARLRQYPEDE
jgi:hypothetical protein